MEKGIIPQSEYEKALKYSKEEILPIAEFFTGIACSARTEWGRSVGHVVQGVLGGRGLSKLQKEIEYYINAGRIKKDFVTSIQGERCLVELLKFLEQEIPDHDRLELLKRIYIVSATEEIHDRESPLPLQFMQMAKSLSAGEILVLFAAYRKEGVSVNSQNAFINELIAASNLEYHEIVSKHFRSLFDNRYLKEVNANAYSNPILIRDLFTNVGRAFCDYVMRYEELQKEK